jgi:hypothetical protein
MNENNELKEYHLNPEQIESMLQTQFGSDIKPVNQEKLKKKRQRQQKQHQLQLARDIFFKNKHGIAPACKRSSTLVKKRPLILEYFWSLKNGIAVL